MNTLTASLFTQGETIWTKNYTSDTKLPFEKICDQKFERDDEFEQYCKDHIFCSRL